MARKPETKDWPKHIKIGSVVVKIYRVAHRKTKNGFLHTVAWHDAERVRRTKQFANLKDAEDEARRIGGKLAAGEVESARMSREDGRELLEMKRHCGDVPPLSAIREAGKGSHRTRSKHQKAAPVTVKQWTPIPLGRVPRQTWSLRSSEAIQPFDRQTESLT